MSRPRFKTRFQADDSHSTSNPVSTWVEPVGPKKPSERRTRFFSALNQSATKEVRELFGAQVFDYPKPVILIESLIEVGSRPGDLIADFFAGSGSTAHASFSSGGRRFLSIQLPEPVSITGYKTIADLCKERIRRAGAKIRAELESKSAEQADQLDLDPPSTIHHPSSPDLGFRVFKLAPSNFKRWDGEAAAESENAIQQQLEAHLDHLASHATEESILFEILLKAGFELTCPVEKLELAGHPVYSVEDGSLLLCLADRIGPEIIDAVAERHPLQFLCLDKALHGDDALKVNALETFRALQPEIQFRTV
ncbi:site-specific DNA-methyltransferase [Verrucomicrobiaceae bacterium E54]|nr:site-specific DNA-methyltransferase [Verrucomicrobiaceae bacterium E54]